MLHPIIFHITFGLSKSSDCYDLEDFDKPKIIYPETTQGAYFAYDKEANILVDKTCFMLISDNAKFLQRILSSKLFEYAYKRIFSSVELGANGYQYNKHAFIKLPVILPNDEIETIIYNCSIEQIDIVLKRLYGLSDDEYDLIEQQNFTAFQ